jgi:hypothetical protein
MEIPGVDATLMALRSREPMTPEAAAAAGLVPEALMRSRQYPQEVQQLELPMSVAQVAANKIAPLPRGAGIGVGASTPATDRLTTGLSYGALAAMTAPSVVGVADWFIGEANGLNSGEVGLNWLLAGIPGLTARASMSLAGLQGRGVNLPLQQAAARQQRMAGGALIGALVGGIPAIMMMQDQQLTEGVK